MLTRSCFALARNMRTDYYCMVQINADVNKRATKLRAVTNKLWKTLRICMHTLQSVKYDWHNVLAHVIVRKYTWMRPIMGVIADTLAAEIRKLSEAEDQLIAAYEDYIEQLQSDVKMMKEERE